MFTHKFKIIMLLVLILLGMGFYNYHKGNCKDVHSCMIVMKDNFVSRTKSIMMKIKGIFKKDKKD